MALVNAGVVVLDCAEPEKLAEFYKELLGAEETDVTANRVEIRAAADTGSPSAATSTRPRRAGPAPRTPSRRTWTSSSTTSTRRSGGHRARRPPPGGRGRPRPVRGARLRRPGRPLLHPAPGGLHGAQTGVSAAPGVSGGGPPRRGGRGPPRQGPGARPPWARRGGPPSRPAETAAPPANGEGPRRVSVPAALLLRRPYAGGPFDGLRAGAVRGAAHRGEDRALDRRGEQDLPQPRSRSRASGASSSCRITFQTLRKASPASAPLAQPTMNPTGW